MNKNDSESSCLLCSNIRVSSLQMGKDVDCGKQFSGPKWQRARVFFPYSPLLSFYPFFNFDFLFWEYPFSLAIFPLKFLFFQHNCKKIKFKAPRFIKEHSHFWPNISFLIIILYSKVSLFWHLRTLRTAHSPNDLCTICDQF